MPKSKSTLQYKTPVYKANVDFGLEGIDMSFETKLTCRLKDAWHLREAALKELRKEINKELKKVRKVIHG